MTEAPQNKKRNLWKTLPGLVISAFFLWYTFWPRAGGKGVHLSQFVTMKLVDPSWVLGVLAFTLASYTLRCVRWTRMMLPTGAGFGVCARVLMTSLAANNILPLRIGDIMRVFTYSGDLGTEPSVILSTVILEKLLDIFTLVLAFVITMGSIATPRLHTIALVSLAISASGLLVLLFGASLLKPKLPVIFAKLPSHGLMAKAEHWADLAFGATARLGVGGSFVLLVQSAVIWMCEGMIYVSSLRLLGVPTDRIGPWLAMSFANLSYLIPSSPGAIGPFEGAIKLALSTHGTPPVQSAVFGALLHIWLLVSVTGAGGIVFLLHRFKIRNTTPLVAEIGALPVEMP